MVSKVALVTGSSRGIGRAISLELAKAGYSLVINYRKRGEEARKTLELVKDYGVDAVTAKADVSDPIQVQNMIGIANNHYGRLDVVVNNAGWGYLTPVGSMDTELWDRHIRVNLNGVFYVTRESLPLLSNSPSGRVINITSIAGIRGLPGLAAYSAAKAGVISFTRALSQELAGSRITVNAVAVGFARTDMGLSFFKATGISVEEYEARYTLTGKLVEPVEVARLVVYLASEDARNITGQVFVIDSGQLLALPFPN
ncbi:MAG: SDR family oxidoreductase [Desulfurococcales archaeon]|nr:SDR family oxidoreductase [Desulfurococcales archaeon]